MRAKSLEEGSLDVISDRHKRACTYSLKECEIELPEAARGLTKWFNAWTNLFELAFHETRRRMRAEDDEDKDVRRVVQL